MILSHYSRNRELTLKSIEQPKKGEWTCYKPRGLWVSVDGEHDWVGWCTGEQFSLEGLACRHVVELVPKAKIMRLRSAADLDRFTNEYVGQGDPGRKWGPPEVTWSRIAESYQGIIIAPYCYQRRLELMWYYGWDCASGCIWDAAAVKSVTLDEAWVAPEYTKSESDAA